MYYEMYGSGHPLVLIAGLNGDHSMFRLFISDLAKKYRVIVFDNRGIGQTDKPDIPYSISMMADDMVGLLQALDVTNPYILGVSMGGKIALDAAIRYPNVVAKLVLVSTGPRIARAKRLSFSRRMMYFSLKLPFIRGDNPYYSIARQRDASAEYDSSGLIHNITAPTLIIHGLRDKLAKYSIAQEMHAAIQDSQMVTLPGGHLAFFAQPKIFLSSVTQFLGA